VLLNGRRKRIEEGNSSAAGKKERKKLPTEK